MLTRRLLLAGTAAVAAAGALPSAARAAGRPVRIGYIGDFPNASLFAVAEDQKLWEPEGLVPDLKVFTNGPIQIQAMGSGSLDFGTIGPGALWLPASGRAKVVAIDDVGFSDRLIVQPGIASIADLKGKKVGVPQGTSGDMILRLGLAKAGLTIRDVEVVPMDPSTVVTAFSSGQIDGAGLWNPLVDVIRRRVPNLRELAANKDFYPDVSFVNAVVARNETVAGDPDLVRAVVRVIKKAIDYRAANLDRSVALTSAFIHVPVEILAPVAKSRLLLTSSQLNAFTRDGTIDRWLGRFNAMFKDFGTVPDPLPPERYYEGQLFLSA
jgi:NitT/TauT family transport system substrate-binding protein